MHPTDSENAAEARAVRQLAQAFSSQHFCDNVQLVTTKLAEYLADDSVRGLALTDPAILAEAVKGLTTQAKNLEQGDIDIADILDDVIDLYVKTGLPVYSPGYMGRQFSGVIPLSSVFDLVNSVVNQPSSFYEGAQLPSVVEAFMAKEFNQFIGYLPECFAMVTTSGGSLANLTAILAARNDKYPDFWTGGITGVADLTLPAIAVSADAHYNVTRAAGILGIGVNQIVALPTNSEKQIDVTQVEHTLRVAKLNGLKVFCLVAVAGTNAMGTFDSTQ